MRNRMAKRKRKEILRRGGKIVLDRWAKDENGIPYKGEQKAWLSDILYHERHIGSGGDDRLEAYNGVLFCMKLVDELEAEDDDADI